MVCFDMPCYCCRTVTRQMVVSGLFPWGLWGLSLLVFQEAIQMQNLGKGWFEEGSPHGPEQMRQNYQSREVKKATLA